MTCPTWGGQLESCSEEDAVYVLLHFPSLEICLNAEQEAGAINTFPKILFDSLDKSPTYDLTALLSL